MTVTAPTAASFKQYMPACCVFHDFDFDIDRIHTLIDEQETLLQAVQDFDNIEPAARTQYAGAIKNPVAHSCSTHLLDTELADLLSCRRGSRSLFQHRLRPDIRLYTLAAQFSVSTRSMTHVSQKKVHPTASNPNHLENIHALLAQFGFSKMF